LKKSGLLNRPLRGKYIITSRGLDVLKEKPERINMKYLEKFQEYLDFKDFRNETIENKNLPSECDRISTPQESLESSYQELRRQLSHDLLERVKQSSPAFFETLVVDLLLKLGYGGSRIDAGQAIGRTGDDGIDGVIKEDKLGLDVVHIQAKRWQNPVAGPRDRRRCCHRQALGEGQGSRMRSNCRHPRPGTAACPRHADRSAARIAAGRSGRK
jgi:restriction system protein